MKKLCFIVYNYNNMGGLEKINHTIISELIKSKNYMIELISICGQLEHEFFSFDKNIIKIHYLFEEELKIRKDAKNIINKLEEIILLNKYDIVISGDMRVYCAEIKRRNKNKFKLILWEHSNSFVSYTWYANIGRRFFLKYTDKLIVLTKQDKENYIKKFGHADKIIQIYNFTSFQENIKKYDIENKKIITVGRIVEDKGYDYIIEIGKKVFDKHPDWCWHIYGSGDENYLNELIKKIKEAKLDNHIFFMGASKKMQEIYSQYSIFCFASKTEGFSLVLLEALSQNLPCISFDCKCGPREIIADNKSGYIIPCFDIKMYQEKLNYLIENPDVRNEFSKYCENIKPTFSLETIIAQWVRLIDTI